SSEELARIATRPRLRSSDTAGHRRRGHANDCADYPSAHDRNLRNVLSLRSVDRAWESQVVVASIVRGAADNVPPIIPARRASRESPSRPEWAIFLPGGKP